MLVSLFIIVVITLSTSYISARRMVDVRYEWAVKVGDSLTYTVGKYYENFDLDSDGNKNTSTTEIKDKEGILNNITLKRGSKIKVTITELTFSHVSVEITYNSNFTIKEENYQGICVSKTVTNKTYWESLETWKAQDLVREKAAGVYFYFDSCNSSVKNNLFIIESNGNLFGFTSGDMPYDLILKINWKTGWLVYLYTKSFYQNGTLLSEMELTSPGVGSASGFEIFNSFLGILLVLLIVIPRKRPNLQRRSNNKI